MIETGDLVRDARGWEGHVIAVEDDTATVRFMLDLREEAVPAAELTYNSWDPKHPDNRKGTP